MGSYGSTTEKKEIFPIYNGKFFNLLVPDGLQLDHLDELGEQYVPGVLQVLLPAIKSKSLTGSRRTIKIGINNNSNNNNNNNK